MKIRYFLGIAVVIMVMIHFSGGSLFGSQSQELRQPVMENIEDPSGTVVDVMVEDERLDQERSIYSKTTIMSLILAVLSIVAFRRNSYL